MMDGTKSKEDLIRELSELRQKVVELDAMLSASAVHSYKESGPANLDDFGATLGSGEHPVTFRNLHEPTETIDLTSLFTKDITGSGSFDVRSDIWATTFGRLIQSLPVPALLVDESFTISVANEAWRKIKPDYENIVGTVFSSLFPGGSATRAQAILDTVFNDRRSRVGKGILDVGQRKRWARMIFRSIRILKERFVLVLIEDLTLEKARLELSQRHQEVLEKEIAERRRAEESLRESEARFRQIYDAAPMMMQCTDERGVIRSVNSNWTRELGYSTEEAVGHSLASFLTPEFRKVMARRLAHLWDKKEARELPYKYLRKDGRVVDALVDSVLTHDPAWGAIALSTVRDITHQLALERQLREAQKMEAIGTLAGGIAHDFNNLLQVILGYADLVLLGKDKSSSEYGRLQAIRESAVRGSKLVNQILTFSRRVETKLRPVDINDVVGQSSELLRRTIPKMIEIELSLSKDIKTVYADPAQLQHVILNLAINAKDAMPQGGKLTLRTQNVTLGKEFTQKFPEVKPGDYVALILSDTGHGIADDVIDRIFEPFFTTKKAGEGTGLGLAMVFGIVKMHKGHIVCHSQIGIGTSFEIYLPAIEIHVSTDLDKTAEMPAFGTETVLMVDDESLIRAWAQELLSMAGYKVLAARDGAEALKIFAKESQRISLVILDLLMPGMGGKECAEKLLEIYPGTKILIVSGFSIDESTREFLESHTKGMITKPLKVKEFLQAVRATLDRP
ncbi:MAG TPA: PAS domain S-box protein [Desulfomonilaceae bacterium]|nr:PAS domain S-box protein [Desulfomonilaceae bacterium]